MDSQTQDTPDEWLLIEGRTEQDRKFRPSDWAERISAILASFGADHRLCYSEYAHPCMIQGEQCLIVARGLHEVRPEIFDFIMNFAHTNQLRIQIDRRIRKESVLTERRGNEWDYSELEPQKKAG